MAKKSPSLSLSLDISSLRMSLQKSLLPLLKHSTVIMVVTATGILIYALLTVQSIITLGDDPSYREAQMLNRIGGQFDKNTIEKIDNLRARTDHEAVQLPSGRRNPFID